jgi:hypothetical protein
VAGAPDQAAAAEHGHLRCRLHQERFVSQSSLDLAPRIHEGQRTAGRDLQLSPQLQPADHQRGIDAEAMAHAMGHCFEVHCRSYPWASTAGTIAAFDRASWALRSRQEATASA